MRIAAGNILCALVFCTFTSAQVPSPTETVLHTFLPPLKGNAAQSSLVQDASGNLYGTTYDGGAKNLGVVFKLAPDGAQTILHTFTGAPDGANPSSGLTLDGTGNLYGVTFSGGVNDFGAVYKVTGSGEYSVLYSFTGMSDGGSPNSELSLDSAGNLYGTASEFDSGVVFKIDRAGHETALYTFSGEMDGADPHGDVILDKKGNLYGTTEFGGSNDAGVIFRITTAGEESVLYNFTGGSDGGSPVSGLTLDSQGNLYGTTPTGGSGYGVVFELDPAHDETVLHAFSLATDGGYPQSGVIRDGAGNLYGTALEGPGGFGVVYRLTPGAQYTILFSFRAPGFVYGQDPEGGLIFGPQGSLLGTTIAGGPGGTGVVFEISGVDQEKVLFSFPGSPGGFSPQGSVTLGPNGNVYGTLSDGGVGFGLVYSLDANGKETVRHTFTGGTDGGFPLSGVTIDSTGNIYGATIFGGTYNAGVIYKIDSAGIETSLYSFTGGPDGGEPNSTVTLDATGDVYGTTSSGGSANLGVVYEVDDLGHETVLHSFLGGTDGQDPQGGVTRDSKGNLFGSTFSGGVNNFGILYRITNTGQEKILHSFTGGLDGGYPSSSVLLDASGNLYGTTQTGGLSYGGVVYELSGGNETVLFSFDQTDGLSPNGLIRDPKGNFYGTTLYGGTNFDGVVFRISPSGTETILNTFTGGADGLQPTGGVALAASGTLYGATFTGGNNNAGLVYQLTPAASAP